MCFDKREIGVDRVSQHILAAIDLTRFFALGQWRAVTGRCEECTDASAGSAYPFRQIALRHQIQLKPAAQIKIRKNLGVGLAGE